MTPKATGLLPLVVLSCLCLVAGFGEDASQMLKLLMLSEASAPNANPEQRRQLLPPHARSLRMRTVSHVPFIRTKTVNLPGLSRGAVWSHQKRLGSNSTRLKMTQSQFQGVAPRLPGGAAAPSDPSGVAGGFLLPASPPVRFRTLPGVDLPPTGPLAPGGGLPGTASSGGDPRRAPVQHPFPPSLGPVDNPFLASGAPSAFAAFPGSDVMRAGNPSFNRLSLPNVPIRKVPLSQNLGSSMSRDIFSNVFGPAVNPMAPSQRFGSSGGFVKSSSWKSKVSKSLMMRKASQFNLHNGKMVTKSTADALPFQRSSSSNFHFHGQPLPASARQDWLNWFGLRFGDDDDDDWSLVFFGDRPQPKEPRCELGCANGRCVGRRARCNGVDDCGDGSDEFGCASLGCDFRCANKRCVRAEDRCNRRNDCGDWSDEYTCIFPKCQFRCTNARCVAASARCDGVDDCGDGSDEIACIRFVAPRPPAGAPSQPGPLPQAPFNSWQVFLRWLYGKVEQARDRKQNGPLPTGAPQPPDAVRGPPNPPLGAPSRPPGAETDTPSPPILQAPPPSQAPPPKQAPPLKQAQPPSKVPPPKETPPPKEVPPQDLLPPPDAVPPTEQSTKPDLVSPPGSFVTPYVETSPLPTAVETTLLPRKTIPPLNLPLPTKTVSIDNFPFPMGPEILKKIFPTDFNGVSPNPGTSGVSTSETPGPTPSSQAPPAEPPAPPVVPSVSPPTEASSPLPSGPPSATTPVPKKTPSPPVGIILHSRAIPSTPPPTTPTPLVPSDPPPSGALPPGGGSVTPQPESSRKPAGDLPVSPSDPPKTLSTPGASPTTASSQLPTTVLSGVPPAEGVPDPQGQPQTPDQTPTVPLRQGGSTTSQAPGGQTLTEQTTAGPSPTTLPPAPSVASDPPNLKSGSSPTPENPPAAPTEIASSPMQDSPANPAPGPSTLPGGPSGGANDDVEIPTTVSSREPGHPSTPGSSASRQTAFTTAAPSTAAATATLSTTATRAPSTATETTATSTPLSATVSTTTPPTTATTTAKPTTAVTITTTQKPAISFAAIGEVSTQKTTTVETTTSSTPVPTIASSPVSTTSVPSVATIPAATVKSGRQAAVARTTTPKPVAEAAAAATTASATQKPTTIAAATAATITTSVASTTTTPQPTTIPTAPTTPSTTPTSTTTTTPITTTTVTTSAAATSTTPASSTSPELAVMPSTEENSSDDDSEDSAEQKSCKHQLWLPFREGLGDSSDNRLTLHNRGVLHRDGMAYFDGSSYLRIPGDLFNRDDLDTVLVKVAFRDLEANASARTLVQKGECTGVPSFGIYSDVTSVRFMVRTDMDENLSTVTVPAVPGVWRKAEYKLQGGWLQGKVNDGSEDTRDTNAIPLKGRLKPSASALYIGGGEGCPGFKGFIEELSVHFCEPDD